MLQGVKFSNRTVVITWTNSLSSAFAKYVSPDVIDHSASVSDYNSSVAFLGALFPTVDVAVIAGLEGCKGNTCAVHYKVTPKASGSLVTNVTVVSDIFKYNGSCIVEHWDSLQTADSTTTNPLFPGN
jgi:predicted SnoaL-like aldol condensation-catalyzing enzyme